MHEIEKDSFSAKNETHEHENIDDEVDEKQMYELEKLSPAKINEANMSLRVKSKIYMI